MKFHKSYVPRMPMSTGTIMKSTLQAQIRNASVLVETMY